MRRFFLLAAISLAVIPLVAPSPRPAAALAGGCCKERSSYRDAWRNNGASFEGCEQLNRQKDGDNVYDERGLVWWDARCN